MSEPLRREWDFYVSDMIAFAEKVVAYTNGLDQEEFVACGLNYDATMCNLSMVSVAEKGPMKIRFDSSRSDRFAGAGKPITTTSTSQIKSE